MLRIFGSMAYTTNVAITNVEKNNMIDDKMFRYFFSSRSTLHFTPTNFYWNQNNSSVLNSGEWALEIRNVFNTYYSITIIIKFVIHAVLIRWIFASIFHSSIGDDGKFLQLYYYFPVPFITFGDILVVNDEGSELNWHAVFAPQRRNIQINRVWFAFIFIRVFHKRKSGRTTFSNTTSSVSTRVRDAKSDHIIYTCWNLFFFFPLPLFPLPPLLFFLLLFSFYFIETIFTSF